MKTSNLVCCVAMWSVIGALAYGMGQVVIKLVRLVADIEDRAQEDRYEEK